MVWVYIKTNFSCLVFYMTVEAEILLHNARGVMIQLDNDSTFFPQALEKIVAGIMPPVTINIIKFYMKKSSYQSDICDD